MSFGADCKSSGWLSRRIGAELLSLRLRNRLDREVAGKLHFDAVKGNVVLANVTAALEFRILAGAEKTHTYRISGTETTKKSWAIRGEMTITKSLNSRQKGIYMRIMQFRVLVIFLDMLLYLVINR